MKTIADFARQYGSEAHKGQFRQDGVTPYFSHPGRVAHLVRQYKESSHIEELVAAAYLHDTLEDTNVTYYDLVGAFGYCIASVVMEVTSNPDMKKGVGDKEHYLAYKLKHMTHWALIIKLCDRLDNIKDMKGCSNEWKKKYIKETLFILNYLKENKELTSTHKKIMEDIFNYIDDNYVVLID